MPASTTPLCDIDEDGRIITLHSRAIELLICEALCFRINDQCREEAVHVCDMAAEPMQVLLKDIRRYTRRHPHLLIIRSDCFIHRYGRKTYISAIETLYREYPLHFQHCWWYARTKTQRWMC